MWSRPSVFHRVIHTSLWNPSSILVPAQKGLTSRFAFGVVPAILVLIAYSQTLNYPFVYDDLSGILDDPLISKATTVGQALQLWLQPWRPATRFTYALTHMLAGFSRPAFHGTNLIIHLANTLLVFGIAFLLARRWLPDFNPAHFGCMAAVIHAVHPLYTEAVTYVSGRSSSLCALFYFACLFFVMCGLESSARKRLCWFGSAAIAAVFAGASKEEAITLPLIVAVFLLLAERGKAAWTMIALSGALLIVRWQTIVSLYRSGEANRPLVEAGLGTPVDAAVYVLSEIKAAVFYYMSRLVMPLTQSVDPYFSPVRSALDQKFLVALLVIAILVVAGMYFRRQHPLLSFAIGALIISPMLAYAAIPLGDIVAEHRIYIAGLGFNLLFAWLLSRCGRFMWVAVAGVSLALMTATIARNSVWASDIRLWQQAVLASPDQFRPHLNLGAAFQVDGQFERALVEYHRALSIRPDVPVVYSNIAAIYLNEGRTDQAEPMLKHAIELAPSMPQPYINLASIAISRKSSGDALDYAAKAEKIGGDACWVHFIRGEALALSNQLDAAHAEYGTAEKLCEEHASLRNEITKRLSASR
jgi:tetratricopeptide (TPR) repeat protein